MLQQKTIIGTDHKAGYSDHDQTVNETVKQLQQAGNTILQLIPREDMDYGSTVIIYQSPLSTYSIPSMHIKEQYRETIGGGDVADYIELKNGLFICIDGTGVGLYASKVDCDDRTPIYLFEGAGKLPFDYFVARSDWKQQEAINYATSIGLKHAFNDAGMLCIELRYNKGICRIDGGTLYSCFYRDMDLWNGWYQPYLNKEQADAFIDVCGNADNGLPMYKWDANNDDVLLYLDDVDTEPQDAIYEELDCEEIEGAKYYYFNNGLVFDLYQPDNKKAVYKIIDTSGTGHGATAPQTLEEIAYYLIENNNGEGIEDIERLDEGEHEDFAGFRVTHI